VHRQSLIEALPFFWGPPPPGAQRKILCLAPRRRARNERQPQAACKGARRAKKTKSLILACGRSKPFNYWILKKSEN
jgi:hypothetical protein